MGCCSHRRKQTEEFPDQKWDYINLADFKTKGCGKSFAYGYLWFLLIISVAVYGVDAFIAVNLLAFDQWSSQIKPDVPFDVSKWIFSICIILSFLNLGYEAFRAFRVIRRGNVAESYLDPLAVRWQSIRVGSGQGYRRFLVFAELTKSKKGAEYIALFTYFSLKSWIRVLICSAPRQVINALTLKAVYEAKIDVKEENVGDSISDFFNKIGALADEDYQQVIILGGMCFTFVVFVFSFVFLVVAILFYVFFLFHWIPRADGGLAGYCERKVNKALLSIVTKKVNTALAKGQSERMKIEAQMALRNGEKPPLARVATLPDVAVQSDALPQMPMLGRNDTTTTLPAYTSRPSTPGGFELGALNQGRPMPSRAGTGTSFASNAPLLAGAAAPGYGRSTSPGPTLPKLDNAPAFAAPIRPGTSNSQRSFGPRQPGMHHMSNTSNGSIRAPMSDSPVSYADNGSAFGPPSRSPTARTMDSYGHQSGAESMSRNITPAPRRYDAYNPYDRSAPTPSSRGGTPAVRPYPPPTRSATGPMPPNNPRGPPQRAMTGGPQPPQMPDSYSYSERSASPAGPRRPAPPADHYRPGTAQSNRGAPAPYGYDVESQYYQRY